MLDRVAQSDFTFFKSNARWLYPGLCSLISSPSDDVRLAVQRVLSVNLAPIVLSAVSSAHPAAVDVSGQGHGPDFTMHRPQHQEDQERE